MRTLYIVIISLLFIFCFAGCNPTIYETDIRPDKNGVITEMLSSSIEKANRLKNQRRYNDAISEYKKVIKTSKSKQECKRAKIGIAQCLLVMKKYSAAVVVLEPLSLNPVSELELEMIALSGHARFYNGRYEDAQSLFEIVVDKTETSPGFSTSSIAPCYGNLGYAYLMNGRVDKSLNSYRKAANKFSIQGDSLNAEKASKTADDIEGIIQKHLPGHSG